jgi:hypothetical protein
LATFRVHVALAGCRCPNSLPPTCGPSLRRRRVIASITRETSLLLQGNCLGGRGTACASGRPAWDHAHSSSACCSFRHHQRDGVVQQPSCKACSASSIGCRRLSCCGAEWRCEWFHIAIAGCRGQRSSCFGSRRDACGYRRSDGVGTTRRAAHAVAAGLWRHAATGPVWLAGHACSWVCGRPSASLAPGHAASTHGRPHGRPLLRSLRRRHCWHATVVWRWQLVHAGQQASS